MRISHLYGTGEPRFSFEFFPPKDDEGADRLFAAITALRELEPAFVSVTHGAGGSRRDRRTIRLVERIRLETGLLPMAHLTCRDSSVDDLLAEIREYQASGIDNVLALRGDPPNGEGRFVAHPGGLQYGSELVRLLTDNTDLCVGAACSPEKHVESASLDDDVAAAIHKVEAGAAFLITQLFFENSVYFSFVARLRRAGVTVPIIPCVMPITNVGQVNRFTAKIGASIPPALRAALESRSDDPPAVLQLGVAWATLQCSELLRAGAPGVHFITLNRSPATRAILSALRVARPWLGGPRSRRGRRATLHVHGEIEEKVMSYAKPLLDSYRHPLSTETDVLAEAVDAMNDCRQACITDVDADLSEPDLAEMVKCIRLCLRCADVCAATADVTSRLAEYEADVLTPLLEACVASCKSCGDECERHAHMHEHCRVCADACRRCEAACRQLLAAATPGALL